jgi:hypothetical protein
LPNRFRQAQERFDQDWMLAREMSAATFDAALRNAGWQLIWVRGSFREMGFGLSDKAAIHRTLVLAFKYIHRRYNAAELESVRVSCFLGLRVARVKLHARHVQPQSGFEIVDEKPRR